jgi:hypothetical protein
MRQTFDVNFIPFAMIAAENVALLDQPVSLGSLFYRRKITRTSWKKCFTLCAAIPFDPADHHHSRGYFFASLKPWTRAKMVRLSVISAHNMDLASGKHDLFAFSQVPQTGKHIAIQITVMKTVGLHIKGNVDFVYICSPDKVDVPFLPLKTTLRFHHLDHVEPD